MIKRLKKYLLPLTLIFIGISYSGAYYSDSVSITNNRFEVDEIISPLPIEVEEIVITEFMANPSAVNDNVGEYFELYNPTSSDINLNGWRYQDTGNGNWNLISTDLIITAGSYKAFAVSDNSSVNGGIANAYKFASNFNLTNIRDGILLQKPDGGGGWISVDEIAYDDGDDAWDITSGVSYQLDDISADNLDPTNWSFSTTVYGDGDLGTPGGPNV